MLSEKLSKLIKEMFLYGVFGICAVSLDLTIFYILRHSTNLNLFVANFISIESGATLSFILNINFNFKRKNLILGRLILFYFVAYCGYLLSTYLIIYAKNAGINEMLAKIGSVFVVTGIQFIINKFITLNKIWKLE